MIITVIPTNHGAGGKFCATSIAYGLRQKYSDARTRICLVDFDFKNPYLAMSLLSQVISVQNDTRGVDSLLEKIDSNTLTDSLFNDNMIKVEGQFDILRGSKLNNAYEMFNRNHIETILEYLKDRYEYIIISVSPETDNAGTVFGLMHADKIVLVSRMNSESFLNFGKGISNIKHFRSGEDKKANIIFNHRTMTNDIDFAPKLAHFKDDINVLGYISYNDSLIDNRNISIGVKAKMDKFSSEYKKQVLDIVNKLVENKPAE